MWLKKSGVKLGGYGLPPVTRPSLFVEAKVASLMKSTYGDVRNLTALTSAIKRFRPEVVFHMAAQPLVLESYRDPVRTYAVNVMGTVHLLEACRGINGLRAIVNVTTDKVYANRESGRGYTESDRLGGSDPYSNSKACSELVTSAYVQSFFAPDRHDSHGVAVACARSGNVIGGGDWARDRLIPDVMRAFLLGRKVRIRSPDAIRPWQHVLEPLHGYIILAEKLYLSGPKFGGAWNFGPSPRKARSVAQVIERLARFWGTNSPGWISDRQTHPHESHDLRLSSAKSVRLLGTSALLPLDEALRLVAEWYRGRADGHNVVTMTMDQISFFEQLGGKRRP